MFSTESAQASSCLLNQLDVSNKQWLSHEDDWFQVEQWNEDVADMLNSKLLP